MRPGTTGRTLIRRTLEWSLVRGGPASLLRRRLRDRILILCYHNVVPDGAEPGADGSLHLPRAAFARQLDLLSSLCRVVPLGDALQSEPDASDDPRPRVAITFDDAYRGALTAGFAELRAREMPATIFVAPGALDQSFWWDEYLDEDVSVRRETALGQLAGQGSRVRVYAAALGWRRAPVPTHAQAVSAAELEQVLHANLVSLGAHSWSHPALPKLADAALSEELTRPIEWLRTRFPGAVLPFVAYPYGLADRRVARAAQMAGYAAGLRVAGGWLDRRPADPFQLPRLNVSRGLSADGFVLRLSGLRTR